MFVDVLGVTIRDATFSEALQLLESCYTRPLRSTVVVHFVNVDVMNLAWDDPSFRSVLNSADMVLGDGHGVRWAARMRRVRLRASLSSEPLVSALLERGSGQRSYCMIGTDPDTLGRAADHARASFPRWNLVGAHSSAGGDGTDDLEVVERVREARPEVLLVGMGSPRQERWLRAHRNALAVPLAISVGGLFQQWAGGGVQAVPQAIRAGPVHLLVDRWRQATRWLRRNPSFVYRIVRDRLVHST